MSDTGNPLSRREFLSANATLLAAAGLGGSWLAAPAPPAGRAEAAPPAGSAVAASEDLARFRPTQASSVAYAATPAGFAVDGLDEVGVRGSGWRAGGGDPQWIEVDLQASCQVEAVTLTFEAKPGDPGFDGTGDAANPRAGTTGFEVLSSYPTAFELTVSADGQAWTSVYRTTQGAGAVTAIKLAAPVTARWVRLTATARSTNNPLGVNGIQIFGTSAASRPAATGWTDWGLHTGTPPALSVAGNGTVALESGWIVTYDARIGGATGADLSRAGVDTTTWLPASVPGTVLGSLVDRGRLPHPAYGWNNLRIPEALSRHSWWHRRQFAVPAGLPTGGDRRVWLEFDGINHHAEIWLDGVRVGDMTHPFSRGGFDVTAQLAAGGDHALAVRIDPMPVPGNPGDRGPDGSSYTDAGSQTMNLSTPTYLAATGWDWMPAIRDRASGIWNHVRLRSTGPVVLGDPAAHTVLPQAPDTSVAEVTLTVPVRNVSAAAADVTVRATLAGVTVTRTVTVAAGQHTDVVFSPATNAALRLISPRLWWPNGYGEAYLHDLALRVTVNGTVSDRRTVRVGLRQVRYDTDPGVSVPAGGSAARTTTFARQTGRYLRVQCGKRATDWGVSMFTLTVSDSARPGVDLALNRPATASSTDDPARGPANAVDGRADTRWSSSYADNQWIQVDLGAGTSFDAVTIVWEAAFATDLRLQVSDDGQSFRDAASVSNGATPMRIVVNGVPVFCRGGSWGFDDLLRQVLPDRLHAAVTLHRDLGFTMVRAWLGSVVREEFFAECDAAGLLVWGEFPSAWFLDPPDHATYLAQTRDLVLRYRSHPSIVLWCAKNEGDPSPEIDAGHRAAIGELTDVYYTGNSKAGPFRGGGAYWIMKPEDYFSGVASWGGFGFHSEIGFPTLPVEESMRRLLGIDPASTEGWPIGGAWYMHDWCTRGAQNPNSYKDAIDAQLGPSTSLGDFCRKAQFVNYEIMRSIFEAFNARLFTEATGVLLWMSHPAWHSTVWQVYDYDLDVNGSYYGARSGSEMVHVQASRPGWDVVAVNHTGAPIAGVVITGQRYDLTGRQLGDTLQATRTLTASSTTAAFTALWPFGAPPVHLLRLTLTAPDGRVLSRNTYWRYTDVADMRTLNNLAPTSVTVALSGTGAARAVTITNTGSTVAVMLRLSLLKAVTGERVLPATYSDNYFWLLPAESQTVTVTSLARSTPARLSVSVEGYNVSRRIAS